MLRILYLFALLAFGLSFNREARADENDNNGPGTYSADATAKANNP